jgi:hypothetical protein
MDVRSEGSFSTRRHGDALEVWMPGWRLRVRAAPLLPVGLAVWTTLSTIPLGLRMAVAAALLGTAYVLVRLTRTGLELRPEGVEVVNILRTHRVAWEDVVAFVGERTTHDGRVAVLRTDGSRLPTSGGLTGEELNPIGEEGDLSAIDQLNRIAEEYRGGVAAAAAAAPEARAPRRVRVKSPVTRERDRREDERRALERRLALEADAARREASLAAQTAELEELTQRHAELTGSAVSGEWHGPVDPGPIAASSPGLRHPWVPRPPASESESRQAMKRRGLRRRRPEPPPAPEVVSVPEPEPSSPGARMLRELERRDDA